MLGTGNNQCFGAKYPQKTIFNEILSNDYELWFF